MSDSSWGRERDLRARPSPAFGGGEDQDGDGGRSDDAVDRVDQLFSQAVERQVAEQRNLNRLLEDVEQQMTQVRNRIDELQKQFAREAGPTLDRLGALDAGLRSLRESVSAQSVALRTEVQESIEKLRDEQRERESARGESLSELREAEGRTASQLHDLAQRLVSSLERIDARQGSLSEDIVGLRHALTEATDAAEQSSTSLSPLVARVSDELSGFRRELEQALRDHVDERLSASVQGPVDQLKQELEQDLGALRTRLDQLAGDLERPAESLGKQLRVVRTDLMEELEQTRAQVEARSRLLAESTETVGDEVTRVLAQSRSEFDDRVASLVDRVAALEAALTERVESSLHGASQALRSQGEELRQDIEARLDAQTREVRDALQGHRSAVEQQAGTVRDASEQLRQQVSTQLGGVRELLEERLAEHRSELQQLQLDQRAGLREQLEEQSRSHAETLAAAMEQFRATAHTLTTELGELEALSTQLTQNRAHEAEQRELLRERLTTDLSEQLREGMQRSGDLLDEELVRVRARLDDGFSGLRDRVDQLERGQQEHLASQDEHLRALAEAQSERLSRLDEQGRTLKGVAEAIDGMTDDVTVTFDGLRSELLAAQAEVLDEIRSAQEDAEVSLVRARESLDRSAAQVESRADVLEDQLAEALDRVAVRLRTESDEANAELRAAGSRLDTTFQHLRHLESSLVAYLEARDRRLEQDRAQVLHTVLGTLTEGLSKRERRKVAENAARAIESLPPSTPVSDTAPTARGALTELLGEEFGADAGSPAAVDEPEIVPVPRTRAQKRTRSKPVHVAAAEEADTPAAEETEGHVCPECGFVAKSAGGLGSHRRTHA